MKIGLDPEARERYGCADYLELDLSCMGIDEAIEIQERLGVNPPDWLRMLKVGDPRAIKAAVWICLNRAGHQIGWADVKFDVFALDLVVDKPASRGKAPKSTPPPPSEPAETP